MKFILLIITLLLASTAFPQSDHEIKKIKQGLELKEKVVYIFCRGTTQKGGLIARTFNIADTNITHIGIGFLQEGTLRIYNVTDDMSPLSALHVDSLESFISCGGVYYFSAWECNCNIQEYQEIESQCVALTKKRVYFDGSFLINESDSLYCSEFCSRVLIKANPGKFNFTPIQLRLNNRLYESFLARKIFSYFPADFFESSLFFTRVFEYRFK